MAAYDVLIEEQQQIADRLKALRGVDAEHEAALAAKEAAVAAVPGDPRAAELAELAGTRGGLDAQAKEVDEAIDAARSAAAALVTVSDHLGSASSWSTFDTWLGGGALASMAKHDRLDQVQRAATYAEGKMALLRRELADVGSVGGVVPSLGITKHDPVRGHLVGQHLHRLRGRRPDPGCAAEHAAGSIARCLRGAGERVTAVLDGGADAQQGREAREGEHR